ncbi:MAG: M28 family peptidase [bacterium]|nr:M28 family peptidase [bacterium]
MNKLKPLMILCVVLCCFFTSGIQAQTNSEEFIELLDRLVKVHGVSTFEERVLEEIRGLLPPEIEYRIDDRNNLLVTIGQGETELLFIAHMDEIGLEVLEINPDGTLSVRKRGGSYNSIWESRIVRIITENGIVNGIIPPRVSYLEIEPAGFSSDDIIVHVGTDSRQETMNLGINKGDFIVQDKEVTRLANNKISTGAADDRAGCTAQLLALKQLLNKRLTNKVTFAWCVEEEIGLNGARFISESFQPDYVFAVDTYVSSDAPRDNKRYAYSPLGDGAVVRAFDTSNLAPRAVYTKVLNIAKNRNISAQLGITSGGNDGSTFLVKGSVDLPLSWPGLYSHSFISVLDMRDVTALSDLITAIALDFEKN